MNGLTLAIDGLAAGTRVVVGCSGGTDSLALLALACSAGFAVDAVYVDHQLRASTAHDIAVVRAAAARFGARAHVVAVTVGAGSNLEARARHARYDALERVRAEVGAAAILVGHTRDDQAETVLLNLLRGSGTAGLAGMAPRRGHVYRPLLGLRRRDTRELCRLLGLAPVHDPMNDDLHHRRVWLRREIVPQLERGAERDLVEVLARQADLVRDDDRVLDALAREHSVDDLVAGRPLDAAVARRVVRQWLGSPPPAAATVDDVLAVARGERRAAQLPGGDRVERAGGRLVRFAPEPAAPVEAVVPVELRLPGRVRFGATAIEAWIERGAPVAWPDGRYVAVCDADRIGDTVVVRPPAPGERFRPLGRGGSKPMRDALAEAGVPAAARLTAPVVAAEGPIWVVGYRIDHRVRVTSRTRRFLWLSAEPIS
ncbi:MAG TPA: tRNA lysidine(34) synthetase TilS [Acidimicrobiia bacterium]|nr:tRNA lysidine(34) synthetase TilS [Acidimicrobiia bacterium]